MMKHLRCLAAAGALGLLLTASSLAAAPGYDDPAGFSMVVSAGAKGCLPNATATVKIRPAGALGYTELCQPWRKSG